MALTGIAIRNAEPRAKPYKMGDAFGPLVLIQPSSGKLWRFKYRFDGREKKLAIGTYLRHFWWGHLQPDGAYHSFANGHFGQRIYLAPDKQLVLVRLGAERGEIDWTVLLNAIAHKWRAA